jgi:hypothetical protein
MRDGRRAGLLLPTLIASVLGAGSVAALSGVAAASDTHGQGPAPTALGDLPSQIGGQIGGNPRVQSTGVAGAAAAGRQEVRRARRDAPQSPSSLEPMAARTAPEPVRIQVIRDGAVRFSSVVVTEPGRAPRVVPLPLPTAQDGAAAAGASWRRTTVGG